jgi:uncharacterized protein YbjT (DUF2867 family)
MRVLLFGSTGMIGQGVLRECLNDTQVSEVISVVRRSTNRKHDKLREIVHADFTDFSSLRFVADACFWCLGVSSSGMNEVGYTRVTHDYTLAAAKAMNPELTFVFVSGQGADGGAMWARVKKRTEDDLQTMGFKAVYVFRPGLIEPLDGIRSRTPLYNALYPFLYPFMLGMKVFAPRQITDTRRIGRAMLHVARKGFSQKTLHTPQINEAAAS